MLGPEHPDTLISVNNLASALFSRGDFAGAEPLFQRTLAAHERILGPEHPDTLGSAHNLAMVLESQGDLANAESLYRRALMGLLKISAANGRPHPQLRAVMGQLAGCLEGQGRRFAEVQTTLETILCSFGMTPADVGIPSARICTAIEQVLRDPSRYHEIAEQLQREDPNLLREFVQWVRN